jgi:hypothetical protein
MKTVELIERRKNRRVEKGRKTASEVMTTVDLK